MTGRRMGAAVLTVFLASGCGRTVTVTGTLDDEDAVEAVWHFGGEERAVVDGGAFRLEDLSGDPIDLRFTSDDGVHARMEIRELAGGARVDLLGVWLNDGLAHASAVELEGADLVTINGIRFAPVGSLPRELDERGVVLAAGRAGDALLVRPLDESLPDLRVVVTPATEVVSPDGDPVQGDGAEVGDTVRIAGRAESGYVVASRLELPRMSTLRDSGDGDGGGRDAAARERRGDEARERIESDDRKKEGRGRGQGRGRGRGRGGG